MCQPIIRDLETVREQAKTKIVNMFLGKEEIHENMFSPENTRVKELEVNLNTVTTDDERGSEDMRTNVVSPCLDEQGQTKTFNVLHTDNTSVPEPQEQSNYYDDNCKPTIQELDLNRTPKLIADIMSDFLKIKFPDLNETCLLSVLLVLISKSFAFKKVKFKELDTTEPQIANIFIILFAISGGGKDMLRKAIEYILLAFINHEIKNIITNYNDKRIEKIKADAATNFPEDSEQGKREKYIKAEIKNLRDINTITRLKGTIEGLYEDASNIKKMGVGGIFALESELGNHLKNSSPGSNLLLDILAEIYDCIVSGRSFKSENVKPDIPDIPVNALLYSDYTIFKGKEIQNVFNTMLETALARRAFITFSPEKIDKYIWESSKIKDNAINEANNNGDKFAEDLSRIFSQMNPDNNVYRKTDEAGEILFKYLNRLEKERKNSLEKEEPPIFRKEIESRELKILKLSAIIAALNHPKDHYIYKKDMEQAIYLTDFLSQDFAKFINYKPTHKCDKVDDVFKYIVENKGKWITKTDLMNERFVHKDKFCGGWWENNALPAIKEMAEAKGYELIEEKHGARGMKYMLTDSNTNKNTSEKVAIIGGLI